MNDNGIDGLSDAALAEAREAIIAAGFFTYADSGEGDPVGIAARLWLEALNLPPSVLVISTRALNPDPKPENLRRSIDPALSAESGAGAPAEVAAASAPHPPPAKPADAVLEPLAPVAEAVSDQEQAAMLDKRLRSHGHRLLALGLFSDGQRYGLAKQMNDQTEQTIFQGPLAAVEALAASRIFNTQPRPHAGRTL